MDNQQQQPVSDLAYAVQELRQATADEWAEPLPCSGLQALNRARRVHFAQQDFLREFSRQHAFGKPGVAA